MKKKNVYLKQKHNLGSKNKIKKNFKTKIITAASLFARKKLTLLLKRKIFLYSKWHFRKTINIRIKSNNVFCTLNDNFKNKTIFSCAASRYKIKITAKRLKHQISRILTFFYHDIKNKILARGIIINIISPKFLRRKIYYICIRYFSRFKVRKILQRRTILYYIKDYKSFNGCRVNKKRRKKRRRSLYLKKT